LETRNRLLDAAEALFHAQGVSHTSLQQIAAEAGVTRGAVYWHFKNKAELFGAMMDRATLPLEATPPDAACLREPGLAALRWSLLHVFQLVAQCERTRRVFEIALQKVEFSGEMQDLQQRKMASYRVWRERHQTYLDAAVRQGCLPATLNTRQAALSLVALSHGLLQQWLLDPEAFDLMPTAEAAVDGFLNGLAHCAPALLPPLSPAERARLAAGACTDALK
jgi:TetR/AcrR family acrAB operon transcriptional repressor